MQIQSGIVFALLGSLVLQAADIPVKQVTLYKHGVGFFEREGNVAAGEEVRLEFRNADMNDILKSLTVTDGAGGQVTGIRYDSNATLEQRLEKYPFKIGDNEPLSAFLDTLKGASLEVRAGERTTRGVILGARRITAGSDAAKHEVSEQITLLVDSGEVTNYDLGALSSLRLLDPRLQGQLKEYLETVAQAKARDKRSVYIDSAKAGKRDLRLSYITPVAIWKSSYRLNLQASDTTLEGWAIVDNTTDEDWNGVRLAVVSGRPISFISLLDTPRYGNRQVAELPEDRAAGPVVYGGIIPSAGLNLEAQTAGVVGGTGGGSGDGDASPAPRTMGKALFSRMTPAAPTSSVQGASGATLGELFEYNFPGPVTVRKNQSAMLPFLQDKISARKLLIYTSNDGEHPVNAAEVINSTAKTLDGGPITVYDGGAYAGEALVETLKGGDKRLIGYAVDYGTRITTAFDSKDSVVREAAAEHGILRVRYAQRQERTYAIKNVDSKAKTLLIQQEGLNEYTVLSPKPTERTATAYRFEVHVGAGATQELKVEQENVFWQSNEVSTASNDFLVAIAGNKQVSESGRRQLQAILDSKRKLADVEANLNANKTQIGGLSEDESRLRQNIDSLNRVKGQEDQVRQYSSLLATNETALAKLRDQRSALMQSQAALQTELNGAIARLSF
jgi:hypothetical protein